MHQPVYEKHRIHADLSNVDGEGRVVLDTVATQRSLDDTGIQLEEGIGLVIEDDDDNEVYGVVTYSNGIWVAEVVEE